MLESKMYKKNHKKEEAGSAAIMLAGIARKNMLDAEMEDLISRLSLPRSKRYIDLMTRYGTLANELRELETQLAEQSPANENAFGGDVPDWMNQNFGSTKDEMCTQWVTQDYHVDEPKSEVLREELLQKLEALKQELEEIKQEVQKELPEASKQLGIIYEMHNEGKLTQMGVINHPGTPIPTIEALDASMDYEDEQEERQWHKAYGVAQAAGSAFLTVEVYRTVVCKVMDDGTVSCYRD